MSSLPPALNFAEAEVEICKKWKEEDSFHQQNKLAEERGDEVSCWCYWLSLLLDLFELMERISKENETIIALPEPMLFGEAHRLTM